MARETGRQRYYRQIEEIRDTLGITHDMARQRWRDYYSKGGKAKKKVKKLVLAVRASASTQRTCPFCRDGIFPPEEGGPDFVCDSCQAHYHLDCFEEELGGRCATLGCAARHAISSIRARARILIRPQTATNEEVTSNTDEFLTLSESGRLVPLEAQETPEEPQEPESTFRISTPKQGLQERLESVWDRLCTASGISAGIMLTLILVMSIISVILLVFS